MTNQSNNNDMENIFGEIIHVDSFNTRLESGEYVDNVNGVHFRTLAAEAGIKGNIMVALTQTMAGVVDQFNKSGAQSVDGRLWDLFNMFVNATKGRIAAKVEQHAVGQSMTFDMIMTRGRRRWITVKATIGPRGPHDAQPGIVFDFVG